MKNAVIIIFCIFVSCIDCKALNEDGFVNCNQCDFYLPEVVTNALNVTDEQIFKCQKRLARYCDCSEKQIEKNFKKCLTPQQKAKYSMIKKLQRNDCKKMARPKNYYKANPQMQIFGGDYHSCK